VNVKREERKENNRKEKGKSYGSGRGWRTDKDERRRMEGALVLVI
jgi:hypothetical protein